MKFGKDHTTYDEDDDYELRKRIIGKYGYLDKEQYVFSKRLIKEMIRRRMKSNQDLADLTELAKSTISNYVNGVQKPRAKELKILSKKLMLPMDYLSGKNNSKKMSAIKIENVLGISEKMMWELCCLNHNNPEFEDLADEMERSDVHKDKLEVFSLLAEDGAKFRELLTYFVRYVKVSQEIAKNDIENSLSSNSTDKLKDDLIRN